MGNLVLLRALEKIAADDRTSRPVIGEIIDASPDVTTADKHRMVKAIGAKGAHFSLFA